MKRIALFSLVLILMLSLTTSVTLAYFTPTWNFQILNNPNARQVALNIANAQQELNRSTEEQSGIDYFKDSLERMAMSKAIRDISYYDPSDEDAPDSGFVAVDDGWIYYQWDPIAEVMRIYHYTDGSWTEITIDTGTKPAPPSF